ncbi:hypothetical protein [Catenuloplanes indicus]|uniref:Uncharacterized protein n=1 Tax=Catenuloplanes indicus TaxID=137267 RepID=A0AAE3VZK9_9ACTN|nr:hypothetical protein [Catenuloplanes indicus]MDQ0366893.1 hypothetical protein [Catenuloplanes indicus]
MQPGRCANSLITGTHTAIWRTERRSLLTLLDNPRLAPGHHAALQRQLDDVDQVIAKATR